MSGFSAQWLALRESADAKARSGAAVETLNRWLADTTPVNIIDLGCGSGSNLRWLAPRIKASQHWSLFDNDPHLLARARQELCTWAPTQTVQADASRLRLGDGLSAQLAHLDLNAQLPSLDGAHVVSASALLDLVSRDWLSRLVGIAARGPISMLFTSNYDGRIRFSPTHTDDAMIRDAVNRDQKTDKGFGPALGPACVAALCRDCAVHGYRVTQWRSDWHIGAEDQAMHAQLVDDFAHIATRQLPNEKKHNIEDWRVWRRAAISTGSAHIGHIDVLALPWTRH